MHALIHNSTTLVFINHAQLSPTIIYYEMLTPINGKICFHAKNRSLMTKPDCDQQDPHYVMKTIDVERNSPILVI